MIRSGSFGCAVLLAALSACAHAQSGLSLERSGLGLKQPALTGNRAGAHFAAGEDGLPVAARAAMAGPRLYFGGVREMARLGYTVHELFGGIAYPMSKALAASLELAALDPTPLSPRRYSLTGELYTPFASGGGLALGLAYRFHDATLPLRAGMAIEPAALNGYTLAPGRARGLGLAPSYQLQLHYRYNPATTFGLVLGRELETFASGFDPSVTGLRQLSFTGQHWLTPSWALSYDVLSDDPGSFRLQGLRFGVRYRF
ncbi:MAG: hypothetical protein IT529_06075 [Burkholderiales bacterium]|nr:hypothetical protein [Burkholderiales bacterium]